MALIRSGFGKWYSCHGLENLEILRSRRHIGKLGTKYSCRPPAGKPTSADCLLFVEQNVSTIKAYALFLLLVHWPSLARGTQPLFCAVERCLAVSGILFSRSVHCTLASELKFELNKFYESLIPVLLDILFFKPNKQMCHLASPVIQNTSSL